MREQRNKSLKDNLLFLVLPLRRRHHGALWINLGRAPGAGPHLGGDGVAFLFLRIAVLRIPSVGTRRRPTASKPRRSAQKQKGRSRCCIQTSCRADNQP